MSDDDGDEGDDDNDDDSDIEDPSEDIRVGTRHTRIPMQRMSLTLRRVTWLTYCPET